jgi:hypothetical protein
LTFTTELSAKACSFLWKKVFYSREVLAVTRLSRGMMYFWPQPFFSVAWEQYLTIGIKFLAAADVFWCKPSQKP